MDDQLFARYHAEHSQSLRDRLILNHLPLVKYVAGRIAIGLPPHLEVGDLESYGLFGLLEAIDRFDPSRGVKFETYASARIPGAILDGLRAQDPAPPAWRQRQKRLEQAYAALEARLGRPPSQLEVAESLGVGVKEIQAWEAEAASLAVVSLDDIWHSGEESGDRALTGGEMLADGGAGPDDALLQAERKRILAEAIEHLQEKERLVLALYYYEGLTAKEVASVLGVTPSRVSQLHGRAILRLRGALSRHKEGVL